jgi:hypothetical protein
LSDGIALGYFFDYLKRAHALKNLQFWLACATLSVMVACFVAILVLFLASVVS